MELALSVAGTLASVGSRDDANAIREVVRALRRHTALANEQRDKSYDIYKLKKERDNWRYTAKVARARLERVRKALMYVKDDDSVGPAGP